MMIKYRVREVAKDLEIPNKEVIDTLAKYFPEPKKYMTALEEKELDLVLEEFTQRRSVENFDAYFAAREKKPEPQPEPAAQPAAEAASAGKKPRTDKKEKAPQKPAQGRQTRPEPNPRPPSPSSPLRLPLPRR